MGRTRKKKKRQRIKKRRKNKQSKRTHTWQECYELAAIRDPVTICDVQGFSSWQKADQIISSVRLAQKFFFQDMCKQSEFVFLSFSQPGQFSGSVPTCLDAALRRVALLLQLLPPGRILIFVMMGGVHCDVKTCFESESSIIII